MRVGFKLNEGHDLSTKYLCESGKFRLCRFLEDGRGDLGRPSASFVKQSFQWAPGWGNEATWLTTWPARMVIINITLFLENQGKYDDAETLCKRALTINEETLGSRHPDVAQSLNIMATLLNSQVMWH